MIVRRERIVRQVTQSGMRVVSIVAPAGFGKSAVAEMIGAEIGPVVICDAAGAANLSEFAVRIVRALQRETPALDAQLASDLFVHLQPGVSSAQLAGFVLEAWGLGDSPRVVVFDNLESIADQADSLDLLARLLKRVGNRTVILCSRTPLALLNSRLIPPHQHVRLRIEDLEFASEEIDEVFENALDPDTARRVLEITQGWPVAVFLLKQLDRLGKLEHALNESTGTDLEDLHDYLLNEVMNAIPERLNGVLSALVATRSSSRDATVRASAGAATPGALLELSRIFPLVRYSASEGRYRVHPLIVSLLEKTNAQKIEELQLATASSFERDGMFAEAARLFDAAGRFEAAAGALERLVGPFVEHDTFAGLEDLIERLPAHVLPNSPRLWSSLAWVRKNIVRPKFLLAEGKALRESGQFSRDSLEAKQVDAVLLLLVTVLGDHTYAERILAEREFVDDLTSPGNVALSAAVTMRDMMMGRAEHGLERSRRLTPLLRNGLLRGSFLLRVDVILDTMAGRFEDALLGHERALALAHSSSPGWMVAGLLADRAFVAWLAGDNAAFERYIEDILHSSGTAAAANRTNLADVWFDGDGAAVAAKLLPRSRAFMLLLLAGRAESAEERSALLEQALAAAHLARDIWVEVLIVTARAMSEPDLRATWLGEALRLAGDIGEPAVAESIRSLMENGSGQPTLAALARRFGGDSTLVKNPAIVRVNALSRTVWRGNSQIVLSNRALSLVLTLAVLKGVRKETLAELLWGVDAVDSGSPALKMLVMRARAQLGDPSLIVANNGGYELRSDVIVDFEEIERLLRSLSPHEPLTELQREALRTAYDRFKASWLLRDPRGPTRSIEAAIAGTRQRVIERLARDALDRGEIGFAFDLADQLRRYDGNDEVAYELLIRAYIRSGNNASALREYRKYSDHLMHDLGLQPSFSLEDLFEHPPSIGR